MLVERARSASALVQATEKGKMRHTYVMAVFLCSLDADWTKVTVSSLPVPLEPSSHVSSSVPAVFARARSPSGSLFQRQITPLPESLIPAGVPVENAAG